MTIRLSAEQARILRTVKWIGGQADGYTASPSERRSLEALERQGRVRQEQGHWFVTEAGKSFCQ